MCNTVKFDDKVVLTMREADVRVLLDASRRFELGSVAGFPRMPHRRKGAKAEKRKEEGKRR
ncbi:hypothetical protein WN51_12829 [Melipona quadrifasciata]|uniref:Uncharacterized protein n=1 Tax=Melipona quadrifasciata TaxID=166423 RepID=A0A0M9A1Y1_9HYME|nr:hypothetical protein WN51_12829 [Melipona quadrifasciata]